jgi:hypothetical protein
LRKRRLKEEKEELLAREEAEIKRRMEKEAKEAEERIALYKFAGARAAYETNSVGVAKITRCSRT